MFDKWFQVDSRPFKQALLNIVKRWSFMFKQHLIDHVTSRLAKSFSADCVHECAYTFVRFCSLHDLEQFIKMTGGGLAGEVQEGDYDGLVEVCN